MKVLNTVNAVAGIFTTLVSGAAAAITIVNSVKSSKKMKEAEEQAAFEETDAGLKASVYRQRERALKTAIYSEEYDEEHEQLYSQGMAAANLQKYRSEQYAKTCVEELKKKYGTC